MSKPIHIYVHRAPVRDAGFEESKHPRASNGEFTSGGGGGRSSKASEVSRKIDEHQSQHAKITGQAMNRQQAAEYVAKGIKPGEYPKLRPLREQVKEDQKRRAREEAEAKAHPNYDPTDHKYLKDKGYSHEEIMRMWNAERDDGKGPQHHEKPPNVVGALSKYFEKMDKKGHQATQGGAKKPMSHIEAMRNPEIKERIESIEDMHSSLRDRPNDPMLPGMIANARKELKEKHGYHYPYDPDDDPKGQYKDK